MGLFFGGLHPSGPKIAPQDSPMQERAPSNPGGFNAPGGWAEKLRKLGTFFLASAGNPAGQRMLQDQGDQEQYQRMQQLQAQQYQQRRADAYNDWVKQQQWKIDHPDPINNDTVNDYNFRLQTLGKGPADEWLKSASDPLVTVTLPGHRAYSGPRS